MATPTRGLPPTEPIGGASPGNQAQRDQDADAEALTAYAKRKRCATCKTRLGVAWTGERYMLRCYGCADPWKPVILEELKRTRRSELPMVETLPATREEMLIRVKETQALGLFPSKDNTAAQLELVARLAVYYNLDPMNLEIMPFHGRPYITLAGRIRLDQLAGREPSVHFRIMPKDEREQLIELGAMDPKDVAYYCVVSDPATGREVEGFGRVRAQDKDPNQRGADHLPTVQWQVEMAQKRAHRKGLDRMYGPPQRPADLDPSIRILQEGDEDDLNIVEGTARVIVDEPEPAIDQLPDFGECPEHPGSYFVTKSNNWGALNVFHKIEGTDDWCRYNAILKRRLGTVWAMAHEGEINDKEINDWLKERYDGKTWSKLTFEQMDDAINAVGEPEPPEETEEQEEPSYQH